VAHPPGYPLFVLLAHPFTWLPIGTVAYRVHLASGFFAAGSCAALWWVVRAMIPRTSTAYVASLALGVSRAFWGGGESVVERSRRRFFFTCLGFFLKAR
jgi:hypothetical protein